MRRAVLAMVIVILVPGAARGAPAYRPIEVPPADPGRDWLVPPVDGPIIKRWQGPSTDWGPGHRGIDFYAPPETAVRAAGAGRVAFAGMVAGVNAVTIEHTREMTTTYTDLAEVLVDEGVYVLEGEWIGRSGAPHAFSGEVGLHFGVKIDGGYVDPEGFLGPLDISEAIYLTPLVGEWARSIPGYGAGSFLDEPCRSGPYATGELVAPNDNIAVVVPGLGSSSINRRPEELWKLASRLGYPEDRTYFFSYRGSDSPDFHQPFGPSDTYRGLREAASKFTAMLISLADRHPDAGVDVLAHSQGGLVARSALAQRLAAWTPGFPSIDHLITYASPHSGSKLADLPDEFRNKTLTGAWITDAVSRWSRGGAALPDPYSGAVRDLASRSTFIDELAHHDVVFGTRVLSLSIPNDWVVPASQSFLAEESNDVVPAEGFSGHTRILLSDGALAVAHSFLRDARPECATASDHFGPPASRAIEFAHDHAADLLGALEDKLLGRVRDGPARSPAPARERGPLRRGDGR